METRLDRFRAYMAQLDAAANPRHALERQLYVAPPDRSLAVELAARLQLNPASSHLVVGGVGSGKTTQLLLALRNISELQDTVARYVDVSTRHDLARMQEGVLVVLAGLQLLGLTKSVQSAEVKEATRAFRHWADGYSEWVEEEPERDWDDNDYEPDYEPTPGRYVVHKGLIAPPLPPLNKTLVEKSDALKALKDALPPESPHVAVLFDSLDRLSSIEVFRASVQNDVRALARGGVACVIVGPSRVLYGSSRSITDLFDQFYLQPTVDVREPAMEAYLTTILRKRAAPDILPDKACTSLVKLSGGVLRDLIALARRAGEEAYLVGSDAVRTVDVKRAADGFGRTLMLGLGSRELQVLQALHTKGTFVATSDQDLALLETRRVLDYGGDGAHRYAVHPAIVPLLDMVA